MVLKKLDSEGNYTHFPGLTVVASIRKQDRLFWQGIYDSMAKAPFLKHYYAPLPYKSYHMTAINLYTEASIGSKDWKQFIVSKRAAFQSLQQTLKRLSFHPQITIEAVMVTGVIQLLVELPREHKNIINQIAKAHNLQAKLPSQYHITLAYQFNPLSQAAKLIIKRDLENYLSLHHRPLRLNEPKLCFFNDMRAFIPWNIETYPFKSSADEERNSPCFFKEQVFIEKNEEELQPKDNNFCLLM